jgi:hypothetical protein
VIPSSNPACLFSKPRTNSDNTCRSRGVKVLYRVAKLSCSTASRRLSRYCWNALSTELSRAASSTGLVKKSIAPSLIARTAIGMSPRPVMKMIGTGHFSLLSVACSSRPYAGHSNVGNQARRVASCPGIEEFLRRAEPECGYPHSANRHPFFINAIRNRVQTSTSSNRRSVMKLSRNCSRLLRFPLHDFEVEHCNAVKDRHQQQRDEGGNRQPANLRITKRLPQRTAVYRQRK